MENKELIKNLGTNITMCFLEGCPRADKCIRHLVYELLGDQKTCGSTVMPSSLKENGECNMYSEAVMKKYAKGAKHIYDEVRVKHYDTIKAGVRRILGGRTTYYRCINGTKLISEEQQKLIVSLFQRYGYDTDKLFDEYVYGY